MAAVACIRLATSTCKGERPKLSDPAHGTPRLQPRCDGRVRCSAWLNEFASLKRFAASGVWASGAFPATVPDGEGWCRAGCADGVASGRGRGFVSGL